MGCIVLECAHAVYMGDWYERVGVVGQQYEVGNVRRIGGLLVDDAEVVAERSDAFYGDAGIGRYREKYARITRHLRKGNGPTSSVAAQTA